jgi:hypothetical protein
MLMLKKLVLRASLIAFVLVTETSYGADKEPVVYPQSLQSEHAAPSISRLFQEFYTAKSRHNIAETMSYFSPALLTYTDATFGWPFDGFSELKAVFDKYMPQWPPSGLSYPVRILGGPRSALVEFIDTKELFGGELRLFGAIDLKDGKIIRWVDYWDGNTFDPSLYQKMRTPAAQFPTDFKEHAVAGDNASARIRDVATKLQTALSAGAVESAAALFSDGAIMEDRTLRTQIVGRTAITRYWSRVAGQVPYGLRSKLRHIVGGDRGGGAEWIAGSPIALSGITALELDVSGKITHASILYDGRLMPPEALKTLATLSLEP